jgi:hypothetical protein
MKHTEYTLNEATWCDLANKTSPAGTVCKVLASRNDGQVLVKIKGISCPKSMLFTSITRVVK